MTGQHARSLLSWGVEFGEKLLYKVKPTVKLEKINSRWAFGIFVGGKEEEWGGMGCGKR